MKRYTFTLEETQEIKAARKKNRDKNVEKRLAALEMRAEGKQNKEISEKTGFHTQYISRHNCPPFQKVVGECGLKWRTGGPRHRGASGHRDQKQGHIKTPAQHDAIRTREILFSLMY